MQREDFIRRVVTEGKFRESLNIQLKVKNKYAYINRNSLGKDRSNLLRHHKAKSAKD